ncbi:hypothetical protein CRG98_034111 [Punica granatum]|uniref:CST complex subunit CTC1 n=1 Tax=Punica granatum TaxID=22663 RepID=A0A2I0IPU4_PUNGR|nr:hypothetical protein CRG98_034111 [Punica granatum]
MHRVQETTSVSIKKALCFPALSLRQSPLFRLSSPHSSVLRFDGSKLGAALLQSSMEASGAELLTLSDLLRRSRPLSGAASLSSSTSRRIPVPNPREEPTTENPSLTLKILVPLNHPVVLVGTVILPVYDEKGDSSIPFKCPSSNSACFRFSDGTSTVCCDVLNFGVPMLGEKIRVLAFNFIPFKHGGGFLEIVKWSFSSSSMAGLRPCSSIASFPLTSGAITAFEDGAKARYNVLGAVESVSPVFIVPCSMTMESNGRHLRGFLVEFMICGCQLCKSKVPLKELVNSSFESHSYSEAVFVYFCGSASRWHPAITKLISSVVVLSGLKKKLMYIEKEESQLVFVVTEKSLLHLLGMPRKWSTHVKTGIKGEGECGHYSGIVRGMYMQGMVVELDKEVWLLLTGQQLILPHSIRIGALIAVKNAHFVRAKFAFTEVLILGHCFKSSIMVGSFSPLETGCHVKPQMQSLLGIFIASLAFSARLWWGLFVKVLPEGRTITGVCKIMLAFMGNSFAVTFGAAWSILGAVLYPSLLLFFTVRLCGPKCHKEGDKLVKNQIRVIKVAAFALEEELTISPASGRLQLFDATGSVDVLIPDLPSTWKSNGIYEVSEYSIIIEGMPQTASETFPSVLVMSLKMSMRNLVGNSTCYRWCTSSLFYKRNSNKMVLVSSGILYSTKREAKTGSCCKPSTQKIMMEFKFSNLSQYQGLQIDGYYIVKHHGKNSSFRFLDSDYAWGEKILITSETKLRSLSIFSSDTPLDNGSSSDAPLGKSHFSTNEIFLGYEIRIPAKAYADYSSVTCSEIHLVAYKDLLGPLELDLKEIQCQFTKMNYSLETVEIFGSLRKHAFPIGLGPGVNATFYRILKLSAQNRFMLTPISFIEIDSVRMDQQLSENRPGHGSVGMFIGVFVAVVVLGGVAVLIGYFCSGKRGAGNSEYGTDMEWWAERKCASCIDGRTLDEEIPVPAKAEAKKEAA